MARTKVKVIFLKDYERIIPADVLRITDFQGNVVEEIPTPPSKIIYKKGDVYDDFKSKNSARRFIERNGGDEVCQIYSD